MRILIVMGGFFPGKKYGGPPVSVDNFCTLMGEEECYIVTTNHDMGESATYTGISNGWNDRKNCKVLYLEDEQYQMKIFEKIIQDIKPELLYLQGLFQRCVFPCLCLAKKHRLKVLLAPRGELCAGAFKKKYKKIPYIITLRALGFLDKIHFQSTSDEETDAIRKYLNISEERIHYLPNIPSLPKQKYERREKQEGVGEFVFLSRIMPKKNLSLALECFRSIEGKVNFDIYGPIENEQYWNECQRIIELLPPNIKVRYKGLVDHENVHEVFSKYHAFIFPTLSENYGHVIAEALLSGCMVIISDQTPWSDVNEYECGGSYSLDHQTSFENMIKKIVLADDADMKVLHRNIDRYLEDKLKLSDLKNNYYKEISKF